LIYCKNWEENVKTKVGEEIDRTAKIKFIYFLIRQNASEIKRNTSKVVIQNIHKES
jgi:hypothetical protein